ncbi:MAG: hypothetical protein U0841_19375 [Chloroflexia bacterium]
MSSTASSRRLVGWCSAASAGRGEHAEDRSIKTEDGAQTWTLLTETTYEREHITDMGCQMASGNLAFFFINERVKAGSAGNTGRSRRPMTA